MANRVVVALCALALSLVAFAHRPIGADPRLSDPQVAAYLAMGGALDALCLSNDPKDDTAAHADCPACTLAKDMALAPTCPGLAAAVTWSGDRLGLPDILILTGHGPRAPPARGPPSIRLI